MARGDILIVDLPAPSDGSGHEQMGARPAIVVQTDTTDADLPVAMIVPVTANLRALRFPHTVRVDPTPQNGLSKPSVLLVFQLRAIDKKRLGKNIGCLDQNYLKKLDAEIRHLLAL